MNTNSKKIIGVVGGVGPYAGIDLVKKIFDQTKATCDPIPMTFSITKQKRFMES